MANAGLVAWTHGNGTTYLCLKKADGSAGAYVTADSGITPLPGFYPHRWIGANDDGKTYFVSLEDIPADGVATILRGAMKGFHGADERVIDVICTITRSKMQATRSSYKSTFGRDLLEDIKCETSGNFQAVLLALIMRPAEYDAYCLRKACSGTGMDEAAITSILCTRTTAEMDAVKAAYASQFSRELVCDLQSERKEAPALEIPQPVYFAREIKKAVSGLGTDDNKLIRVICTQKGRHLAETCTRYLQDYGETIKRAVEMSCSGDYRRSLIKVLETEVAQKGKTTGELGRSLYLQA